MKRRLIFCLLAVFMVLSFFVTALANIIIPEATSKFYVNDFADVFTDAEEKELLDRAVELSDNYDGVQVVVVTIKSLDGANLEEYANKMYNKYGIGRNDMGLLVLVSIDDRKIRIEVGRAMESYITDRKAGEFRDKYAIPYLKNNEFAKGIANIQEQFIIEIKKCLDAEKQSQQAVSVVETVNPTTMPEAKKTSTVSVLKSTPEDKGESIFAWALFVTVFVIFLIYFIFNSRELRKRNDEINRLNDENDEKDRRIFTLVQERHKLQRSFNVVELAYGKQKEEKERIELKHASLLLKYRNLEDWKRRVCILHPESKNEVDDMIRKEVFEESTRKAKEYDERCQKFLNVEVTHKMCIPLSNVISGYDSLNEQQKSLVKTDIFRLRKIYEKATKLKEEYEKELEEQKNREAAKKVQNSIEELVSSNRANADNLRKLQNGLSLYQNLNSNSRKYIDESYVFALKRLVNKAEEDYNRIEAERRRREDKRISMMMHHSSSYDSSVSSSDYGGFGGGSDGGGASGSF